MASRKTKVALADEQEAHRVLTASSDFEVLRLRPGADRSTLKRRYREMAMALHPDKCKVLGCTPSTLQVLFKFVMLFTIFRADALVFKE